MGGGGVGGGGGGVGGGRVVVEVVGELLERGVVGGLGVRGGRVVAAVGGVVVELAVVLGREVVLVGAVVGVGVGARGAADVVQGHGPLALRLGVAGDVAIV